MKTIALATPILFALAAPVIAQDQACTSTEKQTECTASEKPSTCTATQEVATTETSNSISLAGTNTLRGIVFTAAQDTDAATEEAIVALRSLGYLGDDESAPVLGTLIAVDSPVDERGYLGITIDVKDGAMVVTSVKPHSPAAELGLENGDRITRVGDHKVSSEEKLFSFLEGLKAGQKLNLRVVRNGWVKEMDATLSGHQTIWEAPQVEQGEGAIVWDVQEGEGGDIVLDDITELEGLAGIEGLEGLEEFIDLSEIGIDFESLEGFEGGLIALDDISFGLEDAEEGNIRVFGLSEPHAGDIRVQLDGVDVEPGDMQVFEWTDTAVEGEAPSTGHFTFDHDEDDAPSGFFFFDARHSDDDHGDDHEDGDNDESHEADHDGEGSGHDNDGAVHHDGGDGHGHDQDGREAGSRIHYSQDGNVWVEVHTDHDDGDRKTSHDVWMTEGEDGHGRRVTIRSQGGVPQVENVRIRRAQVSDRRPAVTDRRAGMRVRGGDMRGGQARTGGTEARIHALQQEIEELRAELDRMRRLRDEMRELELLRKEMAEVKRALEGDK